MNETSFRERLNVIGGCLCALLFWVGAPVLIVWYSNNQPKPTQEEVRAEKIAAFEGTVAGEWDSTVGDTTLYLSQEDHKAKITVVKVGGPGVESHGSWRTVEPSIFIKLTGAGGTYDMKMERVNGNIVDFLVPLPGSSALLKDCFVQIPDSDAPDDYDPSFR